MTITIVNFLKDPQKRNRILSALQALVGVVAYFLVMQMIAAIYGASGIGLWSLTMGFVAFMRLLDLIGSSGMSRMVAHCESNALTKPEIIDTCFLFLLLLFSILLLFSYAFLLSNLTAMATSYDPALVGDILALAMCSMLLNTLGMSQMGSIDGIGRADVRAIISIFSSLIFICLSLLLIRSDGLVGLAIAQFIQYVFVMIASRLYLFTAVEGLKLVPLDFSASAGSELLRYGFKLQLFSVPMMIFDPLMRLTIGRSAGLEMLGFYDLAYKIAGHTRAILQAFFVPLIPQFTTLRNTSIESAESYALSIQRNSVVPISLVFSAVGCSLPMFSIFVLGELSGSFFIYGAIIIFGWGVVTLMLPINLYARASDNLIPGIVGQVLMLLIALVLNNAVDFDLQRFKDPLIVSTALIIGNVFGYVGELRSIDGSLHRNKNLFFNWSGLLSIFLMGFAMSGFVAWGLSN